MGVIKVEVEVEVETWVESENEPWIENKGEGKGESETWIEGENKGDVESETWNEGENKREGESETWVEGAHSGPSDSTASSLIRAGNRYFDVYQNDEARKYFERAVQAAIRENDSRHELLAMWWLVRIENRLFRFEPALEASVRLYELSAERADTLMMMRALIQEAGVYFETNYNDKAYEVYAAILDLAESAGNDYFRAIAIRHMGQVLTKNRQTDEAIKKFEASNQILKDMGNSGELLYGYSRLAMLYNQVYDNKQSIHYSRLAMELSEATGNQTQTATQLYTISSSHNAMGDYLSALEYAKRALEIRRRLQIIPHINLSLYQIANLYFKTGQFEQALAYNEECLAMEREHSSHVELIYTLTQGAAILEMLDRHEEARLYSREAIDIGYEYRAWHRINPAIRNLARSYINGDEPLQAIELLNEGMALVETTGQDEILGDFYLFRGIAYNMTGNHDAALSDYKNAIAHINTFKERIVPPSYYFHLAQGYRYAGSDSAYTYAREFINSNNRYRENIRLSAGLRAGFMSRFVDQYHEIARWYLEDLNDVVQAYNIIEQARSRTFAESVADAATDFSSMTDDALLVELNEASARYQRAEADMNRNQTTEASQELRDAELSYEIVMSKIRSSSYLFERYHNPEPLKLEQARKLIDRGTAVISYAVTKTHLIGIAFNTTRSTHWTVALDQASGSANLSKTITDFRIAIENGRPLTEINRYGEELKAMLIDPAGDVINGASNLIFVTDGPLSSLPFEVLPRGNAYLVSDFNLKYVPSMTVYSLLPDEQTGYDRDIFILSNPEFGDLDQYSSFVNTPLTRLPHTRIEADSVAAGFSGATRYHGPAATEEVIRAHDLSRYRYIHLATHGIINMQHPRLSGLVLAASGQGSAGGNDAFLRVPEIHTLKLNAELVVLSACNTGLGQILKGEGVLGLQRAFFMAGTRSVMSSLWSVQDRSTASLMGRFYRELHRLGDQENTWRYRMAGWFSSEPDKFGHTARALRNAKLEMINDPRFNHPRQWAGFVIIGK